MHTVLIDHSLYLVISLAVVVLINSPVLGGEVKGSF